MRERNFTGTMSPRFVPGEVARGGAKARTKLIRDALCVNVSVIVEWKIT